MIPPELINQFADSQKRLLRQTYDQAWQQGVDGYEPDEDPQEEPREPRETALAGLTGAALLAALRAYRYVAPRSPDPVLRAASLAPSFRSLDRISAELATLAPSAPEGESSAGSFAQALLDWVDANAWRLDAGESVAWAGEQAGYGEAASADGQLLEWQTEDDDRVCPDCEVLGGMPPLPLSEWPSQPGDGATACNVGCRCSLQASDLSVLPGDVYDPALSDAQQATVGGLLDARSQAMADMMPDAAYLS